MATQRLVTSLVFCEAPLDFFAYGAQPAATGAKLAADARAGEVPAGAAGGEAKARRVAVKPAQLLAECAPAFDGLNCFETVVMPARSGH